MYQCVPTSALDELVELRLEKVAGNKNPNLPYIGLEQIAQGQPRLLGTLPSSSSVSINSQFSKDDILFGKLRPNLRKSLKVSFDGYCSTDILVLRSRIGVRPDFAGHVLQWEKVFSAAASTASGTKMPRTSWNELKRFEVFKPSSENEQCRIAAVLDTVDEAIAKTEAVIAKLRQVRAGLLHDLLTRGLDENGHLRDPVAHPEQFQDSPLGRIPKAWMIKRLDELADVDRGKFAYRPRNEPRFYNGPYPFIQTGDVAKAAGGILFESSQTLNAEGAAISREFPQDTIVVTIAANIADTAILGCPMLLTDSVVGVVVKPPNSVRYVELCIRRAKHRLEARAPQTAQMNINLQDLRPLEIPTPSDAYEQLRISEAYEAHMAVIKAEHANVEKLMQLKSGLMDDLLTGRLRVPKLDFNTKEG